MSKTIENAYSSLNVKVKVYHDHYIIYGYITNPQLRVAGRKICKNKELARSCKHYGNSTQLFHCVKKIGS